MKAKTQHFEQCSSCQQRRSMLGSSGITSSRWRRSPLPKTGKTAKVCSVVVSIQNRLMKPKRIIRRHGLRRLVANSRYQKREDCSCETLSELDSDLFRKIAILISIARSARSARCRLLSNCRNRDALRNRARAAKGCSAPRLGLHQSLATVRVKV